MRTHNTVGSAVAHRSQVCTSGLLTPNTDWMLPFDSTHIVIELYEGFSIFVLQNVKDYFILVSNHLQ